ncbi:MAG: glycosyltransferase [Cyclobacteriaceae bacterium]
MDNLNKEDTLAPIVLFVYNRLKETKLTVEALQKNNLALMSDLYIFSDGAKKEVDREKVANVRNYIRSIKGFRSINIKESNNNKGLATSIIDGVTEVINSYGSVIVLEDDLVTSKNFLDFLNAALNFYKDSEKIISISGYTPNLKSLITIDKDYYITKRVSSLGWGTWENKWKNIDWEVSDYKSFDKDIIKQFKWFRIGSDLPRMLKRQMDGKINSWAIRWCYHQFINEMFTVYASKSKVNHIGDGEEATNAKDKDRFHTILDKSNKRSFDFDKELALNNKIVNEFRNNYSITKRLGYKLKGLYRKYM